jgi:hypothetical protein
MPDYYKIICMFYFSILQHQQQKLKLLHHNFNHMDLLYLNENPKNCEEML